MDGRVRTISYSLNHTDNSVYAVLPHFWNLAGFSPSRQQLYLPLPLFFSLAYVFSEMDPQYSVLVGDPDTRACEDPDKNKALLVEIIVPSVIVVILLVVFIVAGAIRYFYCSPLSPLSSTLSALPSIMSPLPLLSPLTSLLTRS